MKSGTVLSRARTRCSCLNCIVPPHLLRKLMEAKDREIRDAALSTLLLTSRLRGERSVRALTAASAGTGGGRRTIFDCHNKTDLSLAKTVRTEDGPPSTDASANRAFDGLGATRKFYKDVFDRDSIDGHGMRLSAYVHRGERYNNAFWDGQEMVFGDGDGIIFTDFTKSLDVIGHELTHGVTEFTAGLEYHNQSGALNESMSDIFGSLIKQWSVKQTAAQADWLIGSEIMTPAIGGDALRSMKAPGTAYDNEFMGRDPQPAHMKDYMHLPDNDDGDFGGVHINSGIPNKAFYLTATAIGGHAWEAPGHIWYEALRASGPSTDFQEFANRTYAAAGELCSVGGVEQKAVADAWRQVGIKISGVSRRREQVSDSASDGKGDQIDAFGKQIEALAGQVKALAKEVNALRK